VTYHDRSTRSPTAATARGRGVPQKASRERLVQLYGKYGPGGKFTDESHCYLTHQPESVVVCERLDSVPMWLEAVWNDELDAEVTLERFTKHWRFGLGPS
jgi:hypothetical protein